MAKCYADIILIKIILACFCVDRPHITNTQKRKRKPSYLNKNKKEKV
uniref:Uncharacterized protein n=1 Tax=Lepeophtheirus salmonis TaxID=72036 RepID=A0A0K2TP65_LEPSM